MCYANTILTADPADARYFGIRFYDQHKNTILDEDFYDTTVFDSPCDWLQLQEIPDGQSIIGLKASMSEKEILNEL